MYEQTTMMNRSNTGRHTSIPHTPSRPSPFQKLWNLVKHNFGYIGYEDPKTGCCQFGVLTPVFYFMFYDGVEDPWTRAYIWGIEFGWTFKQLKRKEFEFLRPSYSNLGRITRECVLYDLATRRKEIATWKHSDGLHSL